MPQTILSVRLAQMIPATHQSTAFRIFMLSILLFTGSIAGGCPSGGEVSSGARPGGDGTAGPGESASAALAWDPVAGVSGYIIHYGTQSPGSPGSCSYAQSIFSSTPTATVTGLEPNATYFFAVSSYNGLESACSAELAGRP